MMEKSRKIEIILYINPAYQSKPVISHLRKTIVIRSKAESA